MSFRVSIAFRLNARLKDEGFAKSRQLLDQRLNCLSAECSIERVSGALKTSGFMPSLNCLSAECSIESVEELLAEADDLIKSQLPFG